MTVGRWPWYLLFLVPILLLACRQPSSPSYYPLLVIDTFVPAAYNRNDTYLILYDSAGNVLAEDDNGNPDQTNELECSRIRYDGGLSSGTYYILVYKPTNAGNPNYGIRVLDYDPGASFPAIVQADELHDALPYEPDDDVDGNGLPIAPVDIDLDQVISRTIFPSDLGLLGDLDWFRLVLP